MTRFLACEKMHDDDGDDDGKMETHTCTYTSKYVKDGL